MYRPGHYGAALLAYAPLGGIAIALGFAELALLGGVVAVGGAMLPDWDQRVPFIRHRGATHTVWFALAVGVALGLVGVVAGASGGVLAALGLGVFGLLVGVLTVGAHLLADVLTPMGIRPLEPVRDDEYTLDVARAANPIANYGLLALGVIVSGGGLVLGSAIANALGG